MKSNKIRVIGDVHGHSDKYAEIVKDCGKSIQVGDMGFNYSHFHDINSKTKVIKDFFYAGNHDNYDILNNPYNGLKNNLGDYGGLGDIFNSSFFVRGASSIDAAMRIHGYLKTYKKTWWFEEELSDHEFKIAMEMYYDKKPDIMFSHDSPLFLGPLLGSSKALDMFNLPKNYYSKTQHYLQKMYAIHQPKIWFFGHWHKDWHHKDDRTHFFCVDELSWFDLEENEDSYMVTNKDGNFTIEVSKFK